MDSLVLPVAAGILLLGLLVGWALVRSWHPAPSTHVPAQVPSGWRPLIEQRVPLTKNLTEKEWNRLLGLVRGFVRDKNFEGIKGLVITEEMKVIVAAQACLLLLALDVGPFPDVRSIILYPGTFVPRVPGQNGHVRLEPESEPVPLLGESLRGVIVLSWENVQQGLGQPGDGHNVVLHEFAHQLDQEDGYVDGIPLLEAPSSTRVWARVLRDRFEELRRKTLEGEDDLLSGYGATSRAEFFAVATEAFFEQPVEMRDRYPDLYRELKGFYRQDPAERV
ncbi:MAG TPA: M90 family metallopeptidase [Gemmatimonadales bacterium]|nr:M90 family metallopeptidase [Gemmatimonadales bacterium]